MDDLARDGLRTLMFAKKVLTEDQANNLTQETDTEVFENTLQLLGVTGLEDLLQENVKNCIKEFFSII